MASLLTHAALPILVGRAARLPRRLIVLATVCACVSDLDVVGYAFNVRDGDWWGHRGLAHSLLFAAVIAVSFAVLGFRGRPRRELKTAAWVLFAAAASHGVVDALTYGEGGVAFFSPFSNARLHFPLQPVPVSPLGAAEFFSKWGVAVLLNELLWIVLPVLVLVRVVQTWRSPSRWAVASVVVAVVGWAAVAATLRVQLPQLVGPPLARVVRANGGAGSAEDLAIIPVAGLPGEKLVTRLAELQALGLFGRTLSPAQPPWSSTFFPYWFGGEAGRWQQPRPLLIWRTLTGFEPPSGGELKALLAAASAGDPAARGRLFELSPTEKYDLARGDYGLKATRQGLLLTHNASPQPRFWFGLCNGVAAAGIFEPEPFRTVAVTSPDGHRILFHPNDVKALLAASYYWTKQVDAFGPRCERVSLDSGRTCSINPAGLVIAVLNRLGLTRQGFLIDVLPSVQSQFYAVGTARVNLLGAPRPLDKTPLAPALVGKVSQLADIELLFELSSTTLSNAPANVSDGDESRYRKVGFRAVPFRWTATLAMDSSGALIGGRWTGDPANGPGRVAFLKDGPLLTEAGMIELNPGLQWTLIEQLARASVDDGTGTPQAWLAADAGN